jgi:hypothetical protein
MTQTEPYIDYTEQPPILVCAYCEETRELNLPMAISKVVKDIDRFVNEHVGCE